MGKNVTSVTLNDYEIRFIGNQQEQLELNLSAESYKIPCQIVSILTHRANI